MLIDNEIFDTIVWNKVKNYAEREMNNLRYKLAKTQTWEDTLKLQGQIKALELFVALELDKEK